VAWISTLRVAGNLDEAIQRSKGLISTLSNDLRVVKADLKTWKTRYATLNRNTAVLAHEHADVCGNAYDDVREIVKFRGNGKEKANLVEKIMTRSKSLEDQFIEEKGRRSER